MIGELRKHGLVKLPDLLPDIAQFVDRLMNLPSYNAHCKVYSDGNPVLLKDRIAKGDPIACNDFADIVRSPLLEFALATAQTARDYFADPPLLYSLNAFWQIKPSGYSTNSWHRDYDDHKQLALLVYLTDVLEPEDGAHQLKKDGTVTTVLGPAGTAFLVDTSNEHRGLPSNHVRGLAWARWGVSNPPAAYGWDKLFPVELPPEQRDRLTLQQMDMIKLVGK